MLYKDYEYLIYDWRILNNRIISFAFFEIFSFKINKLDYFSYKYNLCINSSNSLMVNYLLLQV